MRLYHHVLCGLIAAQTACAIDLSVPYVRDGLTPVTGGGLGGYGAVIGMIEVGQDGNGIDGFDGHRHNAFYYNNGFGVVPNFIDVRNFANPATNAADNLFHGTFVAGVMASAAIIPGPPQVEFVGMAPFASYYGAVFDGAGNKKGFVSLQQSLDYLVTQGAKAINNSWGGEVPSAAYLNGTSLEALLVDEYAGYRGKTGGITASYLDRLIVMSAGNFGDTTGLLGTPADAFNVLSVGALDVTDPSATAYDDPLRAPAARVAPYSSWRPLADGRSGVDVVAPGTALWSTLAINYTGDNGLLAGVASGTSFAAPHVTGEAALLYGDAVFPGGDTDKGQALSADHKLMKALIINSADKIAGLDSNGVAQTTWQPGWLVESNGVPTALAPLNYAVGAGKANAGEALLEFRETGNRFWVTNTFTASGQEQFYLYGEGRFSVAAGMASNVVGITATLVWDRHLDFSADTDTNNPSFGIVDKDLLSNLDLVVQWEVAPGQWTNLFASAGAIDTVEHIYLQLPDFYASYRIGVLATDVADAGLGEDYALAVSFLTVPEPGAAGLLCAGAGLLALRRNSRMRMWEGP